LTDVLLILWRARVAILSGALVAGAFAFVSTTKPAPAFEGEVLLFRTDLGTTQGAQDAIVLTPAPNQSSLQLSMLANPAALRLPFALSTIEFLIKSPGRLKEVARGLDGELESSGVTAEALASRISLADVTNTSLLSVRAVMPSASLATNTADLVAKAVIEEDKKLIAGNAQNVLRQLDGQLQALRRAIAAGDQTVPGERAKVAGANPVDGLLPEDMDAVKMTKLTYAGLLGRYQLLAAESASDYTRLTVAQPALVSEHVPEFPRTRNTGMGAAAGALFAAIAAMGVHSWTAARPRASR
jgi:uncharacterized protein involved in exopolysaccharide biosynthesis